MALSVYLKKKVEDEKNVIYYYGEYGEEDGVIKVNKDTLEVEKIKASKSSIDKIMYLTSASKIIKMIKSESELPETMSYNS